MVPYSVAGCGMIGVKPTEVIELLLLSNRPFTAANDGIFALSQEEYLGRFLYGHVNHLLEQAFDSLEYELSAYCNHPEIYNSYRPPLDPHSHNSGKAQE